MLPFGRLIMSFLRWWEATTALCASLTGASDSCKSQKASFSNILDLWSSDRECCYPVKVSFIMVPRRQVLRRTLGLTNPSLRAIAGLGYRTKTRDSWRCARWNVRESLGEHTGHTMEVLSCDVWLLLSFLGHQWFCNRWRPSRHFLRH